MVGLEGVLMLGRPEAWGLPENGTTSSRMAVSSVART